MKVLHINDTYSERGGVEQYLLATARLLSSNNHTNVILYHQHTTHTIQNNLWPAYHLDIQDKTNISNRLHRIISLEQPDVAYIHHVSSAALVKILVDLLPSAAYIHGFTVVCPGLAKYYRRGDEVCARAFSLGCIPMHYLRRCSAARRPTVLYRLMTTTYKLMQALKTVPKLLVGSHYMRQLLAQNGFLPERISVLPPHFIYETEAPSNQFSRIPEDENLILFAGRLELEKGFPYLLQALAELPAQIRLKVAGDGTLKEQYIALTQQLGLSSRIEFLGWQSPEALSALYRQAAMLVMPSIMPEPFGKVGIEALHNGKPVVAFNVGGIPDWLWDGVNGFLVEPTNSRQLAQKIDQLLQDSALRHRMGEAGRQFTLEKYRADAHLNQLIEVLGAVIGKPVQSQ